MNDVLTVESLGTNLNGTFLGMIAGAGLMVKFVLIILLIFSIVSWAIMLSKYALFRNMEKESNAFLKYFWEKKQFGAIFDTAKKYINSPFAKMFVAAYTELGSLKKSDEGPAQSDSGALSFEMTGVEAIDRTLKKTVKQEIAKMEAAVPFLATTGNTTPFIGLFGTVWGIMDSFRHIGLKGSASLAVVAPGISEALIATAVGLFAAIPAVVAYNHYVTKINRMALEMENFSSDFLNIVGRHFFKEQKKAKQL